MGCKLQFNQRKIAISLLSLFDALVRRFLTLCIDLIESLSFRLDLDLLIINLFFKLFFFIHTMNFIIHRTSQIVRLIIFY